MTERPRKIRDLVGQLEGERDAVIAEAERVAAELTEEANKLREALRVLLMQSTVVRAENEGLRFELELAQQENRGYRAETGRFRKENEGLRADNLQLRENLGAALRGDAL